MWVWQHGKASLFFLLRFRVLCDRAIAGYLSITEADAALASGELSAISLTEAVFDRIEQFDPALNAYVRLMVDSATAEAVAADVRAQRGDRLGPLDGIPIAVKDIFDTAGVVTTYGAARFSEHRPVTDAHVVRKLREAGAVIIGKTNTHELARGTTTDNAHYGATRNPWDLSRHPGGSSGGSAAALAAGMTLGALGSDTGGSVRIPAHMAGISGLKPTFGLVGRTGARPLVRAFDHVGPMARSVADCAAILEVIAGPDVNDPDCSSQPADAYIRALSVDTAGLRVGIVSGLRDDAVAEIREHFDSSAKVLGALGMAVDSWSLPPHLDLVGAQMVSRAQGYVSIHHMYDGDFSSITAPVIERLDAGADVTAPDYLRGIEARERIERAISAGLADRDVLISPAYPYPAEPVQPFDPRSNDVPHASLFNASRHPALSVPMGFVKGLPVGLQIVGRMGDDATVLAVGHAFQLATKHHLRRPVDQSLSSPA